MILHYTIDPCLKTLTFDGKPRNLTKSSIRELDKNQLTSIHTPNSVETTPEIERIFILSVVIPNTVKKIDKQTFAYCPTITTVHIPNSVKSIGVEAFWNCPALTSIHIPNSVEYVGYDSFRDCVALTSVHIPDSVETIGEKAFLNCSTLASIHVPNSVSIIENLAFWYCPKLHTAFLPTNSNVVVTGQYGSFQPQTALLRPRLKPIMLLQKKAACCATMVAYSVSL